MYLFDAAIFPEQNTVGFDVIRRYGNGDFVAAKKYLLFYEQDPGLAETLTCNEAI